MRFLSAGNHKLRIWFDAYSLSGVVPPGEEQATLTRLVVRAVPAMMYCGWPGGCYVPGYSEPWGGYYSFAFLEKDVLRNINTLIGVPAPRWDPDRAEWKRRGGHCLQEMPLPGKIRSVLKEQKAIGLIPYFDFFPTGFLILCIIIFVTSCTILRIRTKEK